MKNLIENNTLNGLLESLGWSRPKFEVGFGMESSAGEDRSVRWVKELRKGKCSRWSQPKIMPLV